MHSLTCWKPSMRPKNSQPKMKAQLITSMDYFAVESHAGNGKSKAISTSPQSCDRNVEARKPNYRSTSRRVRPAAFEIKIRG